MSAQSEILDMIWRLAPGMMRAGGGGLVQETLENKPWIFKGHLTPAATQTILDAYARTHSIAEAALAGKVS